MVLKIDREPPTVTATGSSYFFAVLQSSHRDLTIQTLSTFTGARVFRLQFDHESCSAKVHHYPENKAFHSNFGSVKISQGEWTFGKVFGFEHGGGGGGMLKSEDFSKCPFSLTRYSNFYV